MLHRWRAWPPTRRRAFTSSAVLSLVVTAVAGVAMATLDIDRGLLERVYSEPGLSGDVLRERLAGRPDLDDLHGPGLPDRFFSARWTGVWRVPADAAYVFRLGADDAARLDVSGQVVVERGGAAGFNTVDVRHRVSKGFQPIELTYEQQAGGAFLVVQVGREGAVPAPLDALELYPSVPTARQLAQRTLVRTLQTTAVAAWLLTLVLGLLAGATRLRHDARHHPRGWAGAASSWATGLRQFVTRPAVRRAVPLLGVALVTAWAGLIRLEALTGRYGRVESPSWLRSFQTWIVGPAPALHPARVTWGPVETPYAGGDPITYLAEARERTRFYEASVREPVFPATTRAFLRLLGDQDVAVSFASATFSTLLVPATYLLGHVAFGPAVGLLAAVAVAGEFTMIDWGIDGWRDDATATFAVLVAWSLLRLRGRWTMPAAVLVGVVGGGAMLTRITMLALFVPGVVLVVLLGRAAPARRRAALGALALAVAAVLVAPYLIACARAYGDPLYAINYHTTFYRFREHVDAGQPQSALRYLAGKLATRPIGTLDTVVFGLVGYPFMDKWTGYRPWAAWLGPVLAACAVAGGFACLLSLTGRLLTVLLLLALLPFAFTWQVPGGAEWRFTLLAYPFYLVASSAAIVAAVSWLRRPPGDPLGWLRRRAASLWPLPLLPALLVALALALALAFLPWLVVREASAGGTRVVIQPGDRGDVVFTEGWAEVTGSGCLAAGRGDARLALPLARPGTVRCHLAPPGNPATVGPGPAGGGPDRRCRADANPPDIARTQPGGGGPPRVRLAPATSHRDSPRGAGAWRGLLPVWRGGRARTAGFPVDRVR